MSRATLVPNGLRISSNASVTGAASAHAALADSSDASYVTLAQDGALRVDLDTFSIPSGGVVTNVAVWLRAHVAGTQSTALFVSSLVVGEGDWLGNTLTGAIPLSATTWAPVSTAVPGLTQGRVDALALDFQRAGSETDGVRLLRAWAEVTYVAKPVVTVTAPTGTITNTNFPTVTWSSARDADGGDVTHYEAQIRSGSTTVQGTGVVAGSATTWTVPTAIVNGTYTARVRTAQTVNGAQLWSDWTSSSFTLNVAPPPAPNFVLTPQPDDGRFKIDISIANADVDAYSTIEIERQAPDGSWTPIRGTGYVTFTSGPSSTTVSSAYDWESRIGVPVTYRVRHGIAEGGNKLLTRWSAWATATETIATNRWFLCHALNPSLRLAVDVHSFPALKRSARQAVVNVAGRKDPVVVSDARATYDATISFRTSSPEARAQFELLLDTGEPLLMRGPDQDGWTPAWVAFGDLNRKRLVDKAWVQDTTDELPFVVVKRPSGNVTAWPT